MKKVMEKLRGPVKEIAGVQVVSRTDYQKEETGLPKSDVLKFVLEGGCTLTVRPSGTEPKLKTYVSVSGRDRISADMRCSMVQGIGSQYMKV